MYDTRLTFPQHSSLPKIRCDEVDCNGLVKARKKCRTHDAIAHPDKYKQPV